MSVFLTALSTITTVIILAYLAGYFWSVGKGKATKHKKVCDICFRDIERINRFLRDKGEEALSNLEVVDLAETHVANQSIKGGKDER